jgi:hypothetical protein
MSRQELKWTPVGVPVDSRGTPEDSSVSIDYFCDFLTQNVTEYLRSPQEYLRSPVESGGLDRTPGELRGGR